jgi:hypothetical protein
MFENMFMFTILWGMLAVSLVLFSYTTLPRALTVIQTHCAEISCHGFIPNWFHSQCEYQNKSVTNIRSFSSWHYFPYSNDHSIRNSQSHNRSSEWPGAKCPSPNDANVFIENTIPKNYFMSFVYFDCIEFSTKISYNLEECRRDIRCVLCVKWEWTENNNLHTHRHLFRWHKSNLNMFI